MVDFGNPIEVLHLAYGEQDVVRFLAKNSTMMLESAVEIQLEKIALPEDEFKTLICEEIALQHPEFLDECAKRGFSVEFRTSKVKCVREIDPKLKVEAVHILEIIAELPTAMEKTTKPQTPLTSSLLSVATRHLSSSNQDDERRRARIEPAPQTTMKKEMAVRATGMLTRAMRAMTGEPSTKALTPNHSQISPRTAPLPPPDVTGNQHEDRPQEDQELDKEKRLDWFEFVDDHESCGAKPEFEDLLGLFCAQASDSTAMM